jgi:hypothetical protein
MKVGLLSRIPWIPLGAFLLAYALLGWYLSAYDIFWFVGACVAVVALALSWKSLASLERLVQFSSPGFLVILVILMLSILSALATTLSILVPIIAIALALTFLANVEMRFAGFSRMNIFLFLSVLAGLGLAFGELIDLLLLASSHRY